MKYRHQEYTVPPIPEPTPAPKEVERVKGILRAMITDGHITATPGWESRIERAAVEIVSRAYLPSEPTADERRVPVQRENGRPAGTVAWSEHLEAYAEYSAKYGKNQSADRIVERGGFGYWEISGHLGHEPKTWRPFIPPSMRTADKIRFFDATKNVLCRCGHYGKDHSWPELGRCYGHTGCICREFSDAGPS